MAQWSLSAQKQRVTLSYSSKLYLLTEGFFFFFLRGPPAVFTRLLMWKLEGLMDRLNPGVKIKLSDIWK